jgi:predicted DNA-binding protein (MmcQ/YjbR family)
MPISGEKLQDRARDTALALPGVSHGRPSTEQLDVYKVAGKAFLIVTDDPDERIVTLKAEPECGRLLQHEHPSIPRAYQPNLRYPALGGVVTPGVECPGRHASG